MTKKKRSATLIEKSKARPSKAAEKVAVLNGLRTKLLEAEVQRLKGALRKALKPAPVRVHNGKATKHEITFAIPDSHGALIDIKARDACLRDLASIKPERIVMLGDHLDCGGTFNAHQRTYTKEMTETYEDDVKATNEFLDLIRAASPNAIIDYIEGNHEQHCERFLARNFHAYRDAEMLLGLVGPAAVLHLAEREISYYRAAERYQGISIPGTIRIGKMHYTHGIAAGQNATSVHLAKFAASVMHGHCLPLDYEVATRRGWVALSEISTSDIVLAYDGYSVVESDVVEVVQYKHTGPVVTLDSGPIRQTMTHLHRVALKDGTSVPVLDAFARGVRVSDLPRMALPAHHVFEASVATRWADRQQFQSGNRVELDSVQLMLARLGIFASRVAPGDALHWNQGPHRFLGPLLSDIAKFTTADNLDVGCITTRYGNFIMRDPTGKVQVTGNTHRSASVVARTVTQDGIGAYCPGTLAKLQPLYMHTNPSGWSHGYGLVTTSGATGNFSAQLVPILNGISMLLDLNARR